MKITMKDVKQMILQEVNETLSPLDFSQGRDPAVSDSPDMFASTSTDAELEPSSEPSGEDERIRDIARDALVLVGELLEYAPSRLSLHPVVKDLLDNLSKLDIQRGVPEEEQTLKNQRAATALISYLAKLDKGYSQ